MCLKNFGKEKGKELIDTSNMMFENLLEKADDKGSKALIEIGYEKETAFEGYKPAIIFKRQGTIGDGNNVCDFHFYNEKKYMESVNERIS